MGSLVIKSKSTSTKVRSVKTNNKIEAKFNKIGKKNAKI
jgi:hypothetical protein